MEKLLGVLFLLSLSLSSTAVSLVRDPVEASICPGDLVTFTCTVETGILRWQDGDGNILGNNYLASTPPGSTQTVNGFTFTLVSVDGPNGNNLVSTATIRPVNSGMIMLQCANAVGGTNRSIAVVIPLPPLVFEPATIDSDNQVRLSWSEPNRTCCVNFLVMVFGRSDVTVNQAEYRISNLPLNTEVNATVRCLTGNNFEGSLSQPQISLLNRTFISSTDRISRCTDDMVSYRTTWSLFKQPTTDQVFTPQLSPDVRCSYGPDKELPMNRVDIRAMEAICQYTMGEAAEGNLRFTINGTTSFGFTFESNQGSTDGNECQELNHLRASVATQQSTIENQQSTIENQQSTLESQGSDLVTKNKIIAGVGGGLGSVVGVLLIAFIGLLVIVTVKWRKLKKIVKQQLGTELNTVNKSVLPD